MLVSLVSSLFIATAYCAPKYSLTQVFEYDEPMEEEFDRRPLVLPNGDFLARIVSGRKSVMQLFSSSGQPKDSYEVQRSFHDRDSFALLSDGTLAVLSSRDKSITFYRDRQLKARVEIPKGTSSLTSRVFGLGNFLLFDNGKIGNKALEIYDSAGLHVAQIPITSTQASRSYRVTEKGEIVVARGGDSEGVRFYDPSGKMTRELSLPGSRYINAPILLKNGNLAVACDLDSLCVYNPDGSLKWRHDLPSRSLITASLAGLPDSGVVFQTWNDGLYFMNENGSVRAHLFAHEEVHAFGPIIVSPEGFVAAFRWGIFDPGSQRRPTAYNFYDSEGNLIGSFEPLDDDATPIALDGKTFLIVDGRRIVELKLVQ